jgi:hypothetical protein
MVGSIGLVASVPISTGLAAFVVTSADGPSGPRLEEGLEGIARRRVMCRAENASSCRKAESESSEMTAENRNRGMKPRIEPG